MAAIMSVQTSRVAAYHQGLTVKDTVFEFSPPHEVVDITPIPPEAKVVPPLGGLNTETATVPACAISVAEMTADS